MGRDFNTDPVRGRLVGLARISAVSSELESQKATIQGFATKLSNSISKWYEDIDRKPHSEQKEQRNKAENVSRGQYNNAKTWKHNGGILPYALDRICVGPVGEERFRLVEDRREANPGHVRGSKQAGEGKYLQFYEVIFPNGHSEIRTDLPGIGEHDRYVFAPSVRTDRLRVIPLIFEMFRDGFSRNAIAKYLTDTKADLGMETYWTPEHISKILRNPIYAASTSGRNRRWPSMPRSGRTGNTSTPRNGDAADPNGTG
jgi:Recombinase